ncbi:hypothetical protein CF326_g8636, partial [Tilletia indica]
MKPVKGRDSGCGAKARHLSDGLGPQPMLQDAGCLGGRRWTKGLTVQEGPDETRISSLKGKEPGVTANRTARRDTRSARTDGDRERPQPLRQVERRRTQRYCSERCFKTQGTSDEREGRCREGRPGQQERSVATGSSRLTPFGRGGKTTVCGASETAQ